MSLEFGREVTGRLDVAESREWLVTNGIGGFASGTVASTLTRRYHGLLVAALEPPLGRTLLVAKLEESLECRGETRALSTNRWADRSIAPLGYRDVERFRLEGTTPVWTFAWRDVAVEKRVFMEPGANTTYVCYRLVRATDPVTVELRALVNYRDYHGTTRGAGWQMQVTPVAEGVRIVAFDGARPFVLLGRLEGTPTPAASAGGPGGPGLLPTSSMPGRSVEVRPAHAWYYGFRLAREEERGLDAQDDHLHAGTFRATLAQGHELTVVLSSEPAVSTAGAEAWQRRERHEAGVLAAWRRTSTGGERPPDWVRQLVLAADQFVVRRPLPGEPEGLTIIAGYPWFCDWGRDTMIALPGLTLTTGRPGHARRILSTFARFMDRGMLPNRFPDAGQAPEYNSVDATLWYVEAIRAYHAATEDDGLLKELYPVLAEMIRWHRQGTRHGIAEDPADGLLQAGEPGVQLTWMDARVGERVVTPRTGKAVEVNALWYNALRVMAAFASRVGRESEQWAGLADRVRTGFGRFWNEATGHLMDVIDGPDGADDRLRPNQLFAVSLSESPLSAARQRKVVNACARHLLTSVGLRSLDPRHPGYRGRYAGGPSERDSAYHQGTVWGWLLGPFALAYHRVYGDRETARGFLRPLAQQLVAYGVGSLGEIFDGDAPHAPRGTIAQAWTVAETLRAWTVLAP